MVNLTGYPYDRPRILKLMEERGWNSAALAKNAHIDHGTVRRVVGETKPKGMSDERAGRMQRETGTRIAQALGVKASVIIPSLSTKKNEAA
jgi:lambda repressor-like predicted transcriptional regulator